MMACTLVNMGSAGTMKFLLVRANKKLKKVLEIFTCSKSVYSVDNMARESDNSMFREGVYSPNLCSASTMFMISSKIVIFDVILGTRSAHCEW